jgi:class 3 adenylate cyclase/CheY-like chemotaxis protein/tRNA A-37 threonylcarbamoyl transferase component Bud32
MATPTRKKILVIDDDESILLAVSRVLTVSGFDVVTAPGGVSGLEMTRSAQPDAVVCDVNMPDVDGFEVLQRVRADPDTVSLPFILLTSADERENVRKAMQMGADDFISKPFKRQELIDAVNQVFEKRARLTEIFSSHVLSQTGELRDRYKGRAERDKLHQPDEAAFKNQTGRLIMQTVLFTDIRSFTRISERLPATAVAEFLTAYLREACQPVLTNGGRVMKFMGDGMMAVFGYDAPNEVQAHAAAGLRAALGILKVAREFRGWLNSRFEMAELPEFNVGVGVHTGEVMFFRLAVGGVGDLTPVGDTVNVASRLEAKCKELRWPIVASSATIEAAGPGFVVAETREVEVLGRDARISVSHVIGGPDDQAPAPDLDLTLPAGAGAVLVENALSTAEATKAALDQDLHLIGDMTLTPAAAPAGQELRIRGYKVLEKIGEGGMSSVFLADDEVHGRKAVLKILKVRRKEDEELWQRFFQECAILSAINHEHVVRIYDQGFGDEMAYIAMEHLGGGSLREVIDRGLSRRQALSLLSQAASGLAAIHSRGIVHRDIKPANLMLRAEGVLVLTDFGVAKRTEHASGHTIQGEVLGTPHYISPEQAQAGEVGPSADLYSLGVIFYEMLTGKRVFTGETILEILSQHIIAPIPRLPAELEDYQPLIDGLLAKKPKDRFADADALLAEIDRIWTSQSIQMKLGVASS